MELIEILNEHAKKYPLLEPCDAVKLIYQNEFGGGHIIKDPEQSLEMLRREFEQTERCPGAVLYENIGNGIIRVNLAALDVSAYPLEKLNRDFVVSAERHRGNIESFAAKLGLMMNGFEEIGFGFSKQELEEYLVRYKKAGYPMVSHSLQYKSAYKPAYRVIEASCLGSAVI